MQKRFPNGTFASGDPVACSPNDKQLSTRQCSLQSGNTVGFYEASSWEYSWFVPHDLAYLITLMGGNVSDSFVPAVPLTRAACDFRHSQGNFIQRLDHFFDAGYFAPGNEPSFQVRSLGHSLRVGLNSMTTARQTPVLYHYANAPASSVDAVRKAVFTNFDISKLSVLTKSSAAPRKAVHPLNLIYPSINIAPAGLPGKDDQAAMASLLVWHLLGFYPGVSLSFTYYDMARHGVKRRLRRTQFLERASSSCSRRWCPSTPYTTGTWARARR
jgi:putative alpha-1,2-mannosidase